MNSVLFGSGSRPTYHAVTHCSVQWRRAVAIISIALRRAALQLELTHCERRFLQRVSIAGNRGHLACFRRYLIELELAMLSAVLAIVNPSVRPSVTRWHSGTVSKRLQLRSWGLHCRIAP